MIDPNESSAAMQHALRKSEKISSEAGGVKPEASKYFMVDDESHTIQVPLYVGEATAEECANAARYLSEKGLWLLQIVACDLRAGRGTIAEYPKDAADAIHAAQALLSLAHNIAEAGLRAPAAKEGA